MTTTTTTILESKKRFSIAKLLLEGRAFLALILIIVVFSLLSPNYLTVDNIRSGNSNIRNPVLASYATSVLPYRGLGNGIVRALREYPDIDFVDDREANRFIVVVRRRYPAVASTGSV